MLKETNLYGVKSIARMLLMTPVHKTPYSPAVVQHPFASSGLVGIPLCKARELFNEMLYNTRKYLHVYEEYTKMQK